MALTRRAARALSTGFGLLMVGSAGVGAHGLAVAAGMAALLAVGAGVAFRPAATLAVVLAVATVMLSGPAPTFVALSGLSAAAYLVCRYWVGASGRAVTITWPTAIAAIGFACAGLAATSFPVQLPWSPLVAPLGVLAIYVVAARPFLS
jgi:hypothetical protein